jgi:hypothetical protein
VRASLAARARRSGGARELAGRRRLQPLVCFEHVAFAVLLASGLAVMVDRGWGLGRARWLDVKLGLVAFLVIPLEAIHAFAAHVWIERGLRDVASTPAGARPRDLERGLAMEEMITTLGAVLLAVALPVLLWLSLGKPF